MNDDELYELAKERIANDNGKRCSLKHLFIFSKNTVPRIFDAVQFQK